MRLLLLWFLTAATIVFGAYVLPWVSVASFGTALLVAIVLGLINITVKPLLLLITLPINVLTLGLFTFVINALMIQLAAYLVSGFDAGNFWTALVLGIFITIVSLLVLDY